MGHNNSAVTCNDAAKPADLDAYRARSSSSATVVASQIGLRRFSKPGTLLGMATLRADLMGAVGAGATREKTSGHRG